MSLLNIGKMDAAIAKNPWVANAQVYIDNNRLLHVNVVQRVPVARIFEENGRSYYIDGTMSIMPVSDQYTYYTTIVTGVPRLSNDSTGKSLMSQVAYVVKRIEQDTFWSAQVSQIIMSADRTFEIVPVLGSQRILLGDTTRFNEKLDNLFAFYKKIMNRIGWDRYQTIDLRYKDQIVASPALQWKVPKETLDGMQWVETIKAKSAYNKNVFSLDSNNVAVVNKQPVMVASTAPMQPTLVVGNSNAGAHGAEKEKAGEKKPAAKVEAKPVVKTAAKAGPKPAVTKTPLPVVKKLERPATAKATAKPAERKDAKKPVVAATKTTDKKEVKKPTVTASKPAEKKEAKKPTAGKPAEKKKVEAKKTEKAKTTIAAKKKEVKKDTKKEAKKETSKTSKREVRKEERKKKKDEKKKKQEAKATPKKATKTNEQKNAKYLYNNNDH
jgi:cell division protein FtsQ